MQERYTYLAVLGISIIFLVVMSPAIIAICEASNEGLIGVLIVFLPILLTALAYFICNKKEN